MVNTVINNYEGSKSAEINRADEVYKTLEHFGNPTVDDFDKMVCDNQIQKCPIISKGITSAKVIFGPYLVEVRGKTVRRNQKGWIVIVCKYQEGFNSCIRLLPWLPMYYL